MKSQRITEFSLEEADDKNYHFFVGACGYEERARHAIGKLKRAGFQFNEIIAATFPSNQILDYNDNRAYFEGLAAKFITAREARKYLGEMLVGSDTGNALRVVFDISSCTRELIAGVLMAFSDFIQLKRAHIELDFIYSLAEFSPPPDDFGPIKFNGPVLPEFSGSLLEVAKPCAAVLGLGYEKDIALGTLESLEPDRVVAFFPVGEDDNFAYAVSLANQQLLQGDWDFQQIPYRVAEPLYLYNLLMAACGELRSEFRPILVPFGPKLFALFCMLVSLAHERSIPVWRVSPVDLEKPVSIKACGKILSFRCTWKAADR